MIDYEALYRCNIIDSSKHTAQEIEEAQHLFDYFDFYSWLENVSGIQIKPPTLPRIRLKIYSPFKIDKPVDTTGIVYLLASLNFEGLYKIGVTTDSQFHKRMVDLNTHSDGRRVCKNKFIARCTPDNYYKFEKELHNKFKLNRLPQSEYFLLSQVELEEIILLFNEVGVSEEVQSTLAVDMILNDIPQVTSY